MNGASEQVERNLAQLAGIIAAHHHFYDGDCGIDYGCMCKWRPTFPEDADRGEQMDLGRSQHARHLAEVLADSGW